MLVQTSVGASSTAPQIDEQTANDEHVHIWTPMLTTAGEGKPLQDETGLLVVCEHPECFEISIIPPDEIALFYAMREQNIPTLAPESFTREFFVAKIPGGFILVGSDDEPDPREHDHDLYMPDGI